MKKTILSILLLCAVTAPAAAGAERVGAVMPSRVPYYLSVHEALVGELAALGSGAEVILQKPRPNEMAWRNTTRKLSSLGARVIVAYGSATARAITLENPDIPVVYCSAYDPAVCGVVGGRVTGVETVKPLQKLLDNLKRIANFSRIGILYSQDEIDSVKQMETVEGLVKQMGLVSSRIDAHDWRSPEFSGVDAVFLTMAGKINNEKNLKMIVAEAGSKKIATAAVLGDTCERGILISLSGDSQDEGRSAAKMVTDILQGKSPQDIPPLATTRHDLIVNLKVARALGLSVPFELLGTAKIVR